LVVSREAYLENREDRYKTPVITCGQLQSLCDCEFRVCKLVSH